MIFSSATLRETAAHAPYAPDGFDRIGDFDLVAVHFDALLSQRVHDVAARHGPEEAAFLAGLHGEIQRDLSDPAADLLRRLFSWTSISSIFFLRLASSRSAEGDSRSARPRGSR
jgi:hypothetical protein